MWIIFILWRMYFPGVKNQIDNASKLWTDFYTFYSNVYIFALPYFTTNIF